MWKKGKNRKLWKTKNLNQPIWTTNSLYRGFRGCWVLIRPLFWDRTTSLTVFWSLLKKNYRYVNFCKMWWLEFWIIYATALTVIVVLRQRAHSMTALEPLLAMACRASIAVILCCAAFWAYHGHYLYTWDSCLWIAGFTIIEANLSQWRKAL